MGTKRKIISSNPIKGLFPYSISAGVLIGFFLLMLPAIVIILPACKKEIPKIESPKAPFAQQGWVIKFTKAMKTMTGKNIYGLGIAGPDPNPSVQLRQARARARVVLVERLQRQVHLLTQKLLEEQKEWFSGDLTVKSLNDFKVFVESEAGNTLILSKQISEYEDPKTGHLYLLYSMEIGKDFYKNFKEKVGIALKKYCPKASVSDLALNTAIESLNLDKLQANEAIKRLDQEIFHFREKEVKLISK